MHCRGAGNAKAAKKIAVMRCKKGGNTLVGIDRAVAMEAGNASVENHVATKAKHKTPRELSQLRRRVEAGNVHQHSEAGKSSVEKAKRKATSHEVSEANQAKKIQKCANHQGLEGNERHMGMCAGYACSSTNCD